MARQRFTRLVLAFTGLLAAGGAAGAPPPTWAPFGPPAGLVATLALDRAGGILVSTTESGVYKSDDSGGSWQLSGAGMGTETVRALAVDPRDGREVAVTATSVFTRTRATGPWTLLTRSGRFGSSASATDVLALSPGAATPSWFLARDRQVFHSGDGGRSWKLVLTPETAVTAILVDPGDPRSVFVGTTFTGLAGGLLHSADLGLHWAAVTVVERLPDNPGVVPLHFGISEMAAIPTRPATLFVVAALGLFRSLDGGATWQAIADLPGPPGAQLSVQSIAAGEGPGAPLYVLYLASGPDGVFSVGALASADLGTTWTRIDRRGLAYGTHLAVQAGTGNLFALATDRIAIGAGQGRRWSTSRLGDQFCGGRAGGEARLAFAGGRSRVVMLVGGRLYTSNDRGARFSVVGPDAEPDGDCAEFQDLVADAASGTWFALSNRALYSSADGVHWQAQPPSGLPTFDPSSFSLAALGGSRLLAGACGISRSLDGGRTWVETLACIDDSDHASLVRRLVVDPEDGNRVLALLITVQNFGFPEPRESLALSEDAGLTWRPLDFPADALAFDRSASDLLTLQGSGFFRSTDLGGRWSKISGFGTGADTQSSVYFGPRADLAVRPEAPALLYVAKWDGFWRSTDGGATWSPQNAGLQPAARRLVRVVLDPTGAGQLYAASDSLFTSPAE
jgi:hypothetical protein